MARESGAYQRLGDLNYFIPHPLPPSNPTLALDEELIALHGEASFALGQLNEMSERLPDLQRFVKAYVIKEALLSSAIEGIHTTLMEVFTHLTSDDKPSKETQLVFNYTYALEKALAMLKEEGLPILIRVILEAHKALLAGGQEATPGHFRKQSVRVGQLIPAPAPEVPLLMGRLEKYINDPTGALPLIRAGLVHVHFETIHPFLDGNGRIGRLLIVLMLINNGILRAPILYPSYYFKKHHLEYYQTLDRVRTDGDFEGWIRYYLKAIRDSAIDAYKRAKEIELLESKLKTTIQTDKTFAKMRQTALQAIDCLFSQPNIGVGELAQKLGKTYNAAQNILRVFVKLNLVSETIMGKRSKSYQLSSYIALLEKESP